MTRRKEGALLPLEVEILTTLATLQCSGRPGVHGFSLAQMLREGRGSRALTGHGTLYKALARLEEAGLVTSRWEQPAGTHDRPRRRLYEVTDRGTQACEKQRTETPSPVEGRLRPLDPRLA